MMWKLWVQAHLPPAHVHLEAPLYEVLDQLDVLCADLAPLAAQALLIGVPTTALCYPCCCCCCLSGVLGYSRSAASSG